MRKKSLKFVLLVNAVLKIKGDQAQVVVKNIKVRPSALPLPVKAVPPKKGKPSRKKLGKSIHDIVLESAKKVSGKAEDGIFTSKDLFNAAIKKYADLNKKSFNTTIISAAPEHTSWKHYKNGKDYLVYVGRGKYKLRSSV